MVRCQLAFQSAPAHGFASPAASGAARWPLFRVDRYPILSDRFVVLDDTVTDANRFRERQCNFWDRFYFRSVIGTVPASAR